MNNNYIKLFWLPFFCIVSVFLAPAQAFNPQPEPPGAQVGLVDTQTARVNVFYGGPDTRPCFLEFRVYDAAGIIVDSDILSVEPGQAIHYDYSLPIGTLGTTPTPIGAASRTQLRFVVLIPRGIINPDLRPACRARNRIVATLEVFDNATGATTLRLNGASIYGWNPQPDPPGRRRRGLFVTDVDD